MKLNIGKCENIKIVGTGAYPNSRKLKVSIILNNNLIKNVKVMKYLGLHLTEKFNFNTHVSKILIKAKAAFANYLKVLNRKCKISNKIKIICYKQILRPIFMYAFPVWFNISKTTMNNLKIFERKCLRNCTGLFMRHNKKYYSNKTIYKEANIEELDIFLIKQALKFLNSLELSENTLIQNILSEIVNTNDKFQSVNHIKFLHDNNNLFVNNNLNLYR